MLLSTESNHKITLVLTAYNGGWGQQEGHLYKELECQVKTATLKFCIYIFTFKDQNEQNS